MSTARKIPVGHLSEKCAARQPHPMAENSRIGNRAYPGTRTVRVHKFGHRFYAIEAGGAARYLTTWEAIAWRLFRRLPDLGQPS